MGTRILGGLLWLLLCLNAAVVVITIALLPRPGYVMYNNNVPFDYFIKSRNWENFPYIVAVSLLVSAGIYGFARACLRDKNTDSN